VREVVEYSLFLKEAREKVEVGLVVLNAVWTNAITSFQVKLEVASAAESSALENLFDNIRNAHVLEYAAIATVC
jgi:hypothetical protein